VTAARPAVRSRHLLEAAAGQFTLTVMVEAISDDVAPSEPAGVPS
jgi:hypothetical protein